MKKIRIDVPAGIRFVSEWEGFYLPDEPSIINKQITGCGFTEWCIRNKFNIILCSPRKILLEKELENKEDQHPGEVLYLRNDSDKVLDVDKDLNKDDIKAGLERIKVYSEEELKALSDHILEMKNEVLNYYWETVGSGHPCKILVTYDSFRHVKEALGDRIKDFYVVVDEFQSIFTDSRFKSSTEMEFLNFLQDIKRLSFVSATPMIDSYLDMLDEFKDLPYYDMNWGSLDPNRIIRPELTVKPCQSILPIAENVIRTYQDGNFQKYIYRDEDGNIQEIESKELVIYVNSVKNICDIIRRCKLTFDNTNVLCSNTPENKKKVRKAFGLKRNQVGGIGSVPKKGEPHKMFTICTRTVYLGADFYSTCARSLILSDANVECLAVDITLDLPQILGRQRLNENPWKNRAELYFKSTIKDESPEELMTRISSKKRRTENLLLSYESSPTAESKHDLAEKYKKSAKSENYRDDYVAVNTRGGNDMFPVFNNLVMISEIRAFEIQQIDYKDRFTVINQIQGQLGAINLDKVSEFLRDFDEARFFTDKMRLLCESVLSDEEINSILNLIPIDYKNYYTVLGPSRIKSLSYQRSKLKIEYNKLKINQQGDIDLKESVLSEFMIGEKYTKAYIKQKLGEIYKQLDIKLSPKAVDIENYFNVKLVDVVDSETGKRTKGFKIIKKKKL